MANGASNADSVRDREIHKVGWLKVIHNSDRRFKNLKAEKIWAAFCVHDEAKPFLEFFDSPQKCTTHQLTWEISLDQCVHITPSICSQHNNEHVFVIAIPSQVIRLGTDTRLQMTEWINTLKNKLAELKVLESKGNIYSKEPELRSSLAPSRDPTSPLPPTPSYAPPLPGTVMHVIPAQESPRNIMPTGHRQRFPVVPASTVTNSVSSPNYLEPNPSHYSNESQFQFAEEMARTLSTSTSVYQFPNESLPSGSGVYEPLFGQVVTACSADLSDAVDPSSPTFNDLASLSQRSQGDVIEENPADGESHPPLTLKEQQVMNLSKEISHKSGVRIKLPRKDCMNMIAFVELFGCVWIAGWKQKDCPFLYNVLHLGDRVITVGGSVVYNVCDVLKIFLRNQVLELDIVLARVPHGKVLAIKRDFEGQDLGIVRDGNTAVIKKVVEGGLASRHGLSDMAPTSHPINSCNWVLTEINGRPLNLFFKNNEIRDRLNAVGKDISILVQPLELINGLKKQLKPIKNYKDFIVQ